MSESNVTFVPRPRPAEVEVAVDVRPFVLVPQADAAGVDATQEPLFWDGVLWPRALSAEMRKWSPEKLKAYATERHDMKADPMRLADILGFDFQEKPHRHLFQSLITIPRVNDDGVAPPVSSLDPRFKKRLVLWSRGTFKTSAVCVLICQIILTWPDTRIIFSTGGDALAKNQLARIKKFFEHPTPEFLRLFPEFCLTSKYDKRHKKWVDLQLPMGSQKRFTVPCRSAEFIGAEPTFSIFTTKSTKSGQHTPWLFLDDLVNDTNSKNPRMLEVVWQQYLDVCPVVDPSGFTICTGTRYSFGDTYERIQDKAREDGETAIWKISSKSCWDYGCMNCKHMESEHDYTTNILQPKCEHEDCIGFAKDTASKGVLFPHATTRKGEQIGWDLEYLEKMKRDMGAAAFANQYENMPIALEDQTFTETMIGAQTLHDLTQFPKRTDAGVTTFALADVAYSDTEKSDKSVIYLFYKWRGALWVFGCISGHWGSSELVTNVLKVMMTVRPFKFYVEKNLGWENLFELIKATAGANNIQMLPIEWIGGAANNKKGAKGIRIRGVQAMLTSRRLWLFAGMEEYQLLVSQLCKFPRGKHDDYADTLGMVCEAPTGWALESPPPPESTTNWLHRLHGAALIEGPYGDCGAGTGIACGGGSEAWK
jgi:phage terminase large subunit-like protein